MAESAALSEILRHAQMGGGLRVTSLRDPHRPRPCGAQSARTPVGSLLKVGPLHSWLGAFAAGEEVGDADAQQVEENHGDGEEDLAHPVGGCEDRGGDEHGQHRVGGTAQ